MDIVEFFAQCGGKWFSQRTSYYLASKQSDVGKADLVIELLEQGDAAVIQLCEQHHVDPAQALCGARIVSNGTALQGKPQSTTTVLVPVGDRDQPNTGQLLRGATADQAVVTSRYVLGADQALTLIAEADGFYSEERLWFASENLRFRTSLLKQAGGFSMASFFSEIRMGVTKPPAS